MDVLSIIGIGIIAAVLALILKQHRPEFALLVSLAAGVFILAMITGGLVPVVERINSMITAANMPSEYAGILLRVLGICFITQIACDTCKDAGETAIAAKVEMAGRVAILIISLPLFEQVLTIAYSLIM